jgi:outer membrane immunogenic protein
MRKQLLGSVAILALMGGVANAADLPAKMYTKAPVIDPWTWTGFYVGANGGYSWGRSNTDTTFTNATTGAVLSTSNSTFNLDGVIGGLQLGYNKQEGSWLWGAETDIQFSGQKGDADAAFSCPIAICQAGNPTFATAPAAARPVVVTNFNQKLDWFGTLRGRVGLLVTPTIVAYGTGGLAYGEVKTDGTITGQTGGGVTTSSTFSNSTTKVGWVVGAGVEGRIMGNWTGKVEYIYMDLGTFNSSGTLATNFIPVTASFSSKITDNILRAGVNYKF